MKDDPSYALPEKLLSAVRWLPDSSQLEGFSLDGRSVKAVFSVTTLEEAAELMKAASKARIPVIPRGSGTMMDLGNPPRGADFVLDLRGLRRVLEYNPENLTATAESGLSLKELQEVLSSKGQFLPLDPPYSSSASLGGIIACNASGPKRLTYGTARDAVLGMKVVLANGSIVTFGGRCVKNVSGFDLCKLFIGSLGTLGVIGEITFKVNPLPEQEAIQLGASPDPKKILELSQSLLHSSLFPAALEVLDPYLASIWSKEMGIHHVEQAWLILIGWVGFFEDVTRSIREGQMAFSRNAVNEEGVCASVQAQRGWRVWGHLSQFLRVAREELVLCRMVLPLKQMQEGINRWQNEDWDKGCRAALSLRAGSGILYGYLLGAEENSAKTAQALERMRNWAVDWGGLLILEIAPLWLKKQLDVWGPTGKELIVMRRLKAHFDPAEILNPGRYWGGI